MKTKQTHFPRVISGMFLIAGTMIGAGMLGIPFVTAPSGFMPGVAITLFVWFLMYCTGLLFLEVTLWMSDGSNVLAMSEQFLGKWGRYLSGAIFIFLYYCLMIAYFAGGGALFGQALVGCGLDLNTWGNLGVFGLIFATVVLIGAKSIDRVNIMMSVAMIASFFILIGSGGGEVKMAQLAPMRWSKMVLAMPVLFSAFGFHNVIPSLCTYLKRDKRALRQSILWGSLLPLLVYLAWQWLVIGTMEQGESLKGSGALPIIGGVQSATKHAYFLGVSRFFAFFAIATSTLGVSFSMVDFFGDGFGVVRREGWIRVLLVLLIFVPPCLFAALNPNIFAAALGVAGGFGETFLNGLFPIGLLYLGQKRWKLKSDLIWLENRFTLGGLALCILFVIGLEVYHLSH